MLSPTQITAAINYNTRQSKLLWKQTALPVPLNDPNAPATTAAFAENVANFQAAHELVVDGQLGPATLSTIRAVQMAALTPAVVLPHLDPSVPVRQNVSNCVIVSNQRVSLPRELQNAGMTVSNFLADGESHFKCWARTKPPTYQVIHESVSTSAPATVRILAQEGYGVHLMIAPDGHVSCHNDLETETPAHANQLNGSSIGIEIVNPYSPLYARPPFTETIPAEWWTWVPEGGKRLYTLPTPAQRKSLLGLTAWLCQLFPSIPHVLSTKGLKDKIPGYDKGAKPEPGIVAHADFSSHADGRWLIEYLTSQGV